MRHFKRTVCYLQMMLLLFFLIPPVAMPVYGDDAPVYTIKTYTSSDTFVVPMGVYLVEVLVVGGGGGGGCSMGGGGGGGAVVYNAEYMVTPNTSIPIVVGSGGTSGISGVNGGNGGASSFDALVAQGGGGGGSAVGATALRGNTGASGGGSNGSQVAIAGGLGIVGQGYAGGAGDANDGGGGGGAGGTGFSGSRYIQGGNGGIGVANSITGNSVYYGGGGGGGTSPYGGPAGIGGIGGGGNGSFGGGPLAGLNGVPNTGGGGGGGSAGSGVGGVGGSGIVIVKWTVDESKHFAGIKTYESDGLFTVPENTYSVEVLVVGGGGAGGGSHYAGGGGGGEVIYNPNYLVYPGTTISVAVGSGGIGVINGNGNNGGQSVFSNIVASGGGGGGIYSASGSNGGSGGGGAGSGTASVSTSGGIKTGATNGYGNAGGNGMYRSGGGGGGAGSAGTNGDNSDAGVGGNGGKGKLLFGKYYGAGGGGGVYTGTPGTGGETGGGNGSIRAGTPTAALPNTGSGGGGASNYGLAGGNGGSGIVIVRWYEPATSTLPEEKEPLPQPAISSIAMDHQAMILTLDSASAPELEYSMTVNGVAIGADGLAAGAPVWYKATLQTLRIIAPAISEKLDLELKARDGDGTESIPLHLENLQELAGIMSEVKGLRGKAGTDSIRLEWLPVKGAQGYEIEMDGAVLTPNPPITEAFHLFTALEPDKSHSFRIRPVKGGISGPWSGLLTVRTTKPVPGEVGTVNAVKGNHWIALSWTAATNAWSYEVELDGELQAAGSSLSLKAEALPQNSVHTVRVRGMNRDGAGPWSPLQYIWTENRVPGSVENLRSVADNKVLSLLWTPHEDAEGYDVKITAFKDDQVQSTEVIETREAYADYFGAKTGYTYTCSVSAKNIAGNGPWTSVSDIALYAISTPVIQWVDAENEDLIIQWELVTDAFKYEIQQDGVIIGEAVRNWYKIPFSDAETHVYRVRGKTVEGGYSNWSEAVESKPVPKRPDWVKELSGFVGADSITLNWTPVAPKTEAAEDAIRGYDVEVDGYIIQTTDTTYRHDNLQPYTDHRYRVRAVTANRDGFWTDFYRIKTPAALLARIYEIRVKSNRHTNIMSWDPVEGAQWYEVEADGKVIKGYSAEWFEQHGVTEFQEHTYRVRACNRYVKGPWSRFVINNAIQAQVKKGEELELGLTATDMTQFSKYRLEVYYPSVLRVEDLCAYTGTKELSSGMIAGTDIEIVNHSPGRVEFIVHKNIDEGTSWTGIINNIVFKGVETGGTTLTYTVHDIEGENEPEKPHDLSIQEKINFEKANPYAPVQ